MSKLQRIGWVTTGRLSLTWALVLAGWMPGAALAQPHPAAEPTPGPSLSAALQFIEDKLSEQGAVNVADHVHDEATGKDWLVRSSVLQSRVAADPDNCKLSFHWKYLTNGSTRDDFDTAVFLATVDHVKVLPIEQAWTEADAREGNTTWSYQADPPVSVLQLKRSDGKSNELQFYDAAMANRVAKVFERAIELCGGAEQTSAAAGVTPLPPGNAARAPLQAWVPARRLALVVGNSDYHRRGSRSSPPTWPDLKGGPLKDADAVSARLRELGFEVTEVKDQDRDQMDASLRQLAERIMAAPDSLTVFYYSGHGARAPRALGEDGEDNYLIPAHTDLTSDPEAYSRAIALTQVRNVLRRSRASVVILDACYSNGLRHQGSRAAEPSGPVAAESVQGMLVAYSLPTAEAPACQPGQMSPYTRVLVKEIGTPGESLTLAFRKLRLELAHPGDAHLPELTDQLNDDVVLVQE